MSAGCHRLDYDRYCDALGTEVDRLVEAAKEADPARDVPSCPGWTVRDLCKHIGGIHRWVEHHVRTLAPERISFSSMGIEIPEDDYAPWLSEGGEALVSTLRAAPPGTEMWAWGPDRTVRFWPRRQLHETAVHRADLELALGREPGPVDAAAAVDGIDEFLENLLHAAHFSPGVKELRGDGELLALVCDEARWLITLTPDGFTWRHAEDDAGATVSAQASDLLLFAYGRRTPEQVGVSGDRELLARWVSRSAI